MSFTRAYTQRELEYIRANWQSKPAREIASELGRSERGIYKKIRDMHLRDGSAPPMQSKAKNAAAIQPKRPTAAVRCIGAPETDHQRLAGLRDLIWDSMQGASPADVARLAPEYRKTIQEMIALDGGGKQARADDGGGGGLAEVLRL